MAKTNLQKQIRAYGVFIFSEGTLNVEHLLARAHDLLLKFNVNPSLRKEIRSVFVIDKDVWKNSVIKSLEHLQYYGFARIPEEKIEEATHLFNENVFDYFNAIAPRDFYFGTPEGDGACFGWFRHEE